VSSGRRTKHGCSAAQLAIAWLLDQEGVIVIPHSYLRLTASLGRMHPKPNAGEHSFDAPDQLHEQLRDTGFTAVEVQTIVQDIEFPSVLDYVRFQLLATPMAALLSDPAEFDRQATIKTIASETAGFSDPAMLEGGRFCFRQEAYVGTARNTN
jgi:hypothetical protein